MVSEGKWSYLSANSRVCHCVHEEREEEDDSGKHKNECVGRSYSRIETYFQIFSDCIAFEFTNLGQTALVKKMF